MGCLTALRPGRCRSIDQSPDVSVEFVMHDLHGGVVDHRAE